MISIKEKINSMIIFLLISVSIIGLIISFLAGCDNITIAAEYDADITNPELTIALDPGHGGEEKGADYYGEREKDINWRIAKLVEEGLSRYDNVNVVLTRDGDEEVGLKERADRAARAGADIFISLHCNASVSHTSHGASVYISTGEAKRRELRDFADYFLGEFEAIGLDNAGTFARVTQMGGRRADGSFDDYYGVLRHSYNNGIPALLIEHCYMDNELDWNYIRNDSGIKRLAEADVNAIAAYYGLVAADGTIYDGKHAKQYGATTKAIQYNYYAPPKLTGIELIEYSGTTPGMASFKVDVEDGIGINSIYLVYKNGAGNSVTVSLILGDVLKTGSHELSAYIPEKLDISRYTLSYVGVYDRAGFDAGYNVSGGQLVGFGKCDWLNTFPYSGEADFSVRDYGVLSVQRMNLMDEKLRLGIRSRYRVCRSDFTSD
ncbi:MAG: N-acetylmuramoyl-L-alanine amidase [Lachnospiraceae bacterium]|nr:N-acetylmuramoyl-L-alanine amidase [Lachnospiraceae bacterium]